MWFVPIRKLGKLPKDIINKKYVSKYGMSYLEIHNDAIYSYDRVSLIDDFLSTCGTFLASVRLIRRFRSEVKDSSCIINLKNLGGGKLSTNIGVTNYSLLVCLQS